MPDANPTADKEQGSFWNLRWRDSRSKWISGFDFDSGTPEARAPMQRTLTLLDIPKSTDPFRAALVAQMSDLPSFPDDFRDLTGKNVRNAGDISLKVHLVKAPGFCDPKSKADEGCSSLHGQARRRLI